MWFGLIVGFALLFSAAATFLIGGWLPAVGQEAKLFVVIFAALVGIFAAFTGRYYPVVKFLGFIYAAAFLMGYFFSSFNRGL